MGETLEEFAQTKTGSTKCWVCSLPERKELDQAKMEGKATLGQMVDWLTEVRGHSPDEARLRRVKSHFDSRHHLEKM